MTPPTSSTGDRASSGVTLLEALVAVTILVMVAAALPAFFARGPGHAETVRAILADLRGAREAAIASGAPVDFSVDLDARTFGRDDEVRALPEGVDVSVVFARAAATAAGEATFRFFADGSATGGRIDVFGEDGAAARIKVHWLTGIAKRDG